MFRSSNVGNCGVTASPALQNRSQGLSGAPDIELKPNSQGSFLLQTANPTPKGHPISSRLAQTVVRNLKSKKRKSQSLPPRATQIPEKRKTNLIPLRTIHQPKQHHIPQASHQLNHQPTHRRTRQQANQQTPQPSQQQHPQPSLSSTPQTQEPDDRPIPIFASPELLLPESGPEDGIPGLSDAENFLVQDFSQSPRSSPHQPPTPKLAPRKLLSRFRDRNRVFRAATAEIVEDDTSDKVPTGERNDSVAGSWNQERLRERPEKLAMVKYDDDILWMTGPPMISIE